MSDGTRGVGPDRRRTRIRWLMVIMAFLGITINYIDRANLGVALPFMRDDFQLSSTSEGLILGAFFWTYAVFQLPSGWAADRFGARVVYAVAVIWWSVFTVATALGRGFASLFGLRLLLGVGEAAAYPSSAKVVSQWFPKQERAFATSIFDNGARAGTALALPIVTALIAVFGWRASFVLTGLIGLVWVVFWIWLYRTPRSHPWVSQEELEYIEAGGARTVETEDREEQTAERTVRWRDLFRYRTVLGMMLGFFCLNFVIYFFLTWFPSYLVEARGFDLLKLGFFGTIPALVAILGGWSGGLTSDYLVRRGLNLTVARKVCLVGGMLFSSVIALAVIAPSAVLALMLLSVCYASLAFAAASVWSLPADVAPSAGHVASIGGIQNFASNLAGIVTTFLIGFLLDLTGGYVVPLIMAGGFSILGALSYLLIVGRIEPLPPLPPSGGAQDSGSRVI